MTILAISKDGKNLTCYYHRGDAHLCEVIPENYDTITSTWQHATKIKPRWDEMGWEDAHNFLMAYGGQIPFEMEIENALS